MVVTLYIVPTLSNRVKPDKVRLNSNINDYDRTPACSNIYTCTTSYEGITVDTTANVNVNNGECIQVGLWLEI